MSNDSAEDPNESTLTPGQRLAAARAAKSARKAAARGREAEMVEEKALSQAAAATDWLSDNLRPLAFAAAGILTVATVGIFWSAVADKKSEEAGTELAAVLDATIYDEAELAEAYATVARDHAGTVAATWAKIGEARARFDQGEFALAREAYEAALAASEDESMRWVALEGIAFTYEAEENYAAAIEKLEALQALGGQVAPIASYHQARMLIAQGKSDEAKLKLQSVLNDLRQPDATALPFTRRQAEARLARIDPTLAPVGAPDVQALQRQLNEMMLRQQQQAEPPTGTP